MDHGVSQSGFRRDIVLFYVLSLKLNNGSDNLRMRLGSSSPATATFNRKQ